jgi:hypothetical protein
VVLNTLVDDVDLLNRTIALRGLESSRREPQSRLLPLTPEAAKIGFDLLDVALANKNRLLFRGSHSEHPLSMSAISSVIRKINANFVSIGVSEHAFLMRDLRATMLYRMAEIGIDSDTRHRVQGRATDPIWKRFYDCRQFINVKRSALTQVADDLCRCAAAAATARGLTWSGFEVLPDPGFGDGLPY